ncbi:MAG TPA: hypothetical protein VMY35_19510 [Phycisphaerae bacterium]|nr:hypothetical protein [Phycisphaerae bacterium]
MDMTLDVTQVLLGLDGEPLLDGEKASITLRPICINALMATMETDKGLSGEDKVKIWVLAGKIQKEDRPVLVAEDVTLLKKRIGSAYGPAIVGPAFLLLNGTAATPPAAKK